NLSWNNLQHRKASSHAALTIRRTATLSSETQGFQTSLTRRKGSPACELFPEIQYCSYDVSDPARQGKLSLLIELRFV
ncbi:MAG: hypothetical protein OXP09_20470, partial [Gammaproteobacteria bacterium]|nr:hypothetical protein [Gammaproteobacteria bacterium]